ncbi:MAG: DUF86 domain-containing protein [Actinomycetota bacterium]|nr:DUF86 domain-containing protein [Actinomycetota bacterium]
MRDDHERLADILVAADKIRARVRRGRDSFVADEDLQIVLIHLVQVIGEAASRVTPELTAQHPRVPWRQIVGMRNRVVHDYFEIDLDILWAAVTHDVPRLAMQITLILSDPTVDSDRAG